MASMGAIAVAVAVAVPNFAANADMPSRIASLPMMMIPDRIHDQ